MMSIKHNSNIDPSRGEKRLVAVQGAELELLAGMLSMCWWWLQRFRLPRKNLGLGFLLLHLLAFLRIFVTSVQAQLQKDPWLNPQCFGGNYHGDTYYRILFTDLCPYGRESHKNQIVDPRGKEMKQ